MRHFLILIAVAVLLAGGYFALVPRKSFVEGRVFLRALDGAEMPGASAKLACYPVERVDGALGRLLAAVEQAEGQNNLALQAARSAWSQAGARRDEASRVLHVAELSNSSDLEICRARHREAAADAEDALRKLELMQNGASEATDPERFVADLNGALFQCSAGPEGHFRIEVPGSTEIYFAVSLGGGRVGKAATVWLRRGMFEDGEKIIYSNETILTAEQLLKMARDLKNAGSREAPPGS
ncbi:MAG: hypothetical protein RIQ71_1598 [Verrucomicrobiota bacterium]|jgi:hypothetical protein